jgi:O-antigen ligase
MYFPFMGGTVNSESIVYRQRLVDRSLQLIMDSPFFGDRFAVSKNERPETRPRYHRSGQHLFEVALDYGMIGFALFVGFILVALAERGVIAGARGRSTS